MKAEIGERKSEVVLVAQSVALSLDFFFNRRWFFYQGGIDNSGCKSISCYLNFMVFISAFIMICMWISGATETGFSFVLGWPILKAAAQGNYQSSGTYPRRMVQNPSDGRQITVLQRQLATTYPNELVQEEASPVLFPLSVTDHRRSTGLIARKRLRTQGGPLLHMPSQL